MVSFPSRGQTTVNVPLNVSFLQTGAAVAQAIRTGVAEVKLDAILNAAGASLPVKVAKTVEPQRVSGSAGPWSSGPRSPRRSARAARPKPAAPR